ncbi:MAG: flagellar protein [Rhodobacterales bacterium]|nr:MAG: flagellar protein [Rhodobacterales bacterium]
MSFQPIIPFGGVPGWKFLQATRTAQQEAFETAPALERDTTYFAENIGKIQSAEELVNDYRLLKVALGAFGLDEDLPNKAFIQKVLEEGSLNSNSFANRMVDKRYLALAEAFGFDLSTPNTHLSDFPDRITKSYNTRQFEIAVGEQDSDMRLSLALDRDLGKIVGAENTANGKWYAVLGNEPLLKVFQTALNIPAETAGLDIDDQVSIMRKRATAVFGNGEIDQFAKPEKLEELNRLFLVRSQINDLSGSMSSGAIALTLLQAI